MFKVLLDVAASFSSRSVARELREFLSVCAKLRLRQDSFHESNVVKVELRRVGDGYRLVVTHTDRYVASELTLPCRFEGEGVEACSWLVDLGRLAEFRPLLASGVSWFEMDAPGCCVRLVSDKGTVETDPVGPVRYRDVPARLWEHDGVPVSVSCARLSGGAYVLLAGFESWLSKVAAAARPSWSLVRRGGCRGSVLLVGSAACGALRFLSMVTEADA